MQRSGRAERIAYTVSGCVFALLAVGVVILSLHDLDDGRVSAFLRSRSGRRATVFTPENPFFYFCLVQHLATALICLSCACTGFCHGRDRNLPGAVVKAALGNIVVWLALTLFLGLVV